MTGAAVVLAGMIATTSPALASSIADGTSNTIQFGVAPAPLDQATQAASGVCAFPDVCAQSGDGRLIVYNGHAGLGSNA
ncbi:MAG TPA: hypothetical protein VFM58_02590 [Solirubrobacteraceae bacterium]|nr:hypothetical protein [Solirubrobacteraceae bacterium]